MSLRYISHSRVATNQYAVVAFTESTLGRFLAAVELYIIIIYILIASFYHYVPASADSRVVNAAPRIPEQKRRSTFVISPYAAPTQNPVISVDHPYQNGAGAANDRSKSPSAASRLSGWVTSRRISRQRSVKSDDQRLWNQDEAERGQSPVDRQVMDGLGSPYSYVDMSKGSDESDKSMAPDMSEKADDGTGMSQYTASTGVRQPFTDIDPLPKAASKEKPAPIATSRQRMQSTGPSTAFSIGSYYSVYGERNPRPRQTDSPVYGLDGIVDRVADGRQSPEDGEPSRDAPSRNTIVSFTELLRQQSELDNSIAALRLLSPQQESAVEYRDDEPEEPVTLPTESNKNLNRSTSSSIGVPSSLRSEFSLSNFPDPPITFSSTANGNPSVDLDEPSTAKPRLDKSEKRKSRMPIKQGGFELPPPRMPILNVYSSPQDVPNSPRRSSEDTVNMGRQGKINSGGTQYDVTSFIGSE